MHTTRKGTRDEGGGAGADVYKDFFFEGVDVMFARKKDLRLLERSLRPLNLTNRTVHHQRRVRNVRETLVQAPNQPADKIPSVLLRDALRHLVDVLAFCDKPTDQNFEDPDSLRHVDEKEEKSPPRGSDRAPPATRLEGDVRHQCKRLDKEPLVDPGSHENGSLSAKKLSKVRPPEFIFAGVLRCGLGSLQNPFGPPLDLRKPRFKHRDAVCHANNKIMGHKWGL